MRASRLLFRSITTPYRKRCFIGFAGKEEAKLTQDKIDTFICVHKRDVDYLLELVLRSYEVNFVPKGKLTLITNDLPYLQTFIKRTGIVPDAELTTDADWLTAKEMALPGWYKQQVIKLKAYQFCTSTNFCNLGADTILLQPITRDDLLAGEIPVLYYSQHRLPDLHVLYERGRVQHVARILQVKPTVALRYIDFINDVFCFNRELLIRLNKHLEAVYGQDYYHNLLCNLDNSDVDRKKFGEWTLYSVFILDCLKQMPALRNTRDGFLHQVHSQRTLNSYRFNTKAVHFVGKNFDLDYIRRQIILSGSALSHALQSHHTLATLSPQHERLSTSS